MTKLAKGLRNTKDWAKHRVRVILQNKGHHVYILTDLTRVVSFCIELNICASPRKTTR